MLQMMRKPCTEFWSIIPSASTVSTLLRPFSLRFALLAAALLLASGSANAQTALPIVHIGSTLADDTVAIAYGIRSGLFQRAGIDVQLIPATSGAAVTEAVLSGAYEFGKSSLVAIMNAHLRGLPVVIVAADAVNNPKTPYGELCVAIDSTISTGKDFAGKTVAVLRSTT